MFAPFVVADPLEKARFRRTVQPEMYSNARLGSWRPTVEEPMPPMKMVLRSEFWVADKYAELRGSFEKPRPKPRVQQQELEKEGQFGVFNVPGADPSKRDAGTVYRMRDALHEDIATVNIGLVVVEVTPEAESDLRLQSEPG